MTSPHPHASPSPLPPVAELAEGCLGRIAKRDVKDIIGTAGVPTERGSAVRRDRRPATDAPCAVRISAARAVVLGKTVTTEFGTSLALGTRTAGPAALWRSLSGAAGSRTVVRAPRVAFSRTPWWDGAAAPSRHAVELAADALRTAGAVVAERGLRRTGAPRDHDLALLQMAGTASRPSP